MICVLFSFIEFKRNWPGFFRFNLLCSVPFDWKNPLGYLVVFVIQSIIVWHNFCFTSAMVSFAIGIFLFVTALLKDVIRCLHQFNSKVKLKKNRSDADQKLPKIIEYLSTIKQLSKGNVFVSEMMKFWFSILFYFTSVWWSVFRPYISRCLLPSLFGV